MSTLAALKYKIREILKLIYTELIAN